MSRIFLFFVSPIERGRLRSSHVGGVCLVGFLTIFSLVFLAGFSPFSLSALGTQGGTGDQEKEHEPIVEKVTVTNVEVPVRVLLKGMPVTDLKKEDFTIYEDKKEMVINGFFLKKKMIDIPTVNAEVTGPTGAAAEAGPAAPRYFVLVFSITDFNDYLTRAVEHVFEKVLRANDSLLVFANNKTLEYLSLADKETIKTRLLTSLKEESQKARNILSIYINKIETYLNVDEFRAQLHRQDNAGERVLSFLKKYLVTWNEYKMDYLTPNPDRFYFFSRYLENLKGEKWVLNFYQFDLFPNIRLNSSTMNRIRDLAQAMLESKEAGNNAIGSMINTVLDQVAMDMNVSKGFPTEEISKLFYKVDATFHSFFIKSMNTSGRDEVEFQQVSSEIENTLKQITDVTGGKNITSNDLVKSIETVSEIEDAYYILTYVPPDSQKAGKLKINVKGKGLKVLYDDNFREDYIAGYFKKMAEKVQTPDIKVRGFSFRDKILAFTVKDYLVRPANNKNVGQMKVRIRLINREDNAVLFDQEKVVTADKTEMKISLGAFKAVKKGEYNFLIDAVDMFTGKVDNFHQGIEVKK